MRKIRIQRKNMMNRQRNAPNSLIESDFTNNYITLFSCPFNSLEGQVSATEATYLRGTSVFGTAIRTEDQLWCYRWFYLAHAVTRRGICYRNATPLAERCTRIQAATTRIAKHETGADWRRGSLNGSKTLPTSVAEYGARVL